MSNIPPEMNIGSPDVAKPNVAERDLTQDMQQAAADAKTAVIATRRRLATRFFTAIAGHPHTIVALLAAAAAIIIAFGLLRG